ncbi:MAG: UDP-glucose 4-epimerase [Candidatus Celerinatantimonas neptuna]|nr:MAG: UDP-glucose 4-epimerase [Candidatus Celerinatantimonas neptuna]
MNSINILITGGLGYIGSHTAVQLIKSKYTPIIIDNLSNSSQIVLDRIEELTGVRPIFYNGDVRDRDLLDNIFVTNKIDAVIHFAGYKAVGESVEKPLEYYDNNIYSTLVLTQAMRSAGVKKLIFSSSATVYGKTEVMPISESSPIGGTTNPYATSKLMIEKCLQDLFVAENDWSLSLLRYFNPVGAHPSGKMGEDPKGIPNNLMPYIAQVAVGVREKVSVFGNDYPTKDGTGVRDYIHVMDLADGHVAALKTLSNEMGVHIYNLSTGVNSSVLEVIEAFSKVSGKQIPYEFCERRAGDVAECWAITENAELKLGWKAKRDINDMALDSWRWQSNNPNGYQ